MFQSDEIKDKIKDTNLERYGVENVSFSPEIVEKITKSVRKTYSSDIDQIKEKQRLTNIEKYGVEDVNKESWFKDKIKYTFIEKYGVDNPSKVSEIRNKIISTNLRKYGVEHASQSKEIKDKIIKTNIEKYGVISPMMLQEIKDKMKKTNLERYGVEYISQNPEIYESKILSGYKIKKHECGLSYQGTYEKDFIDTCIKNNIKITKSTSILYELKGESRRYYPDFYIKELNLIVEVKSKYYYELHREKNELKKQSTINNGFRYLMILDKNYEEFLKLFA